MKLIKFEESIGLLHLLELINSCGHRYHLALLDLSKEMKFRDQSLNYNLLTSIKCDNKTVFLPMCVLSKYRIIIRTYLSISLPSGNNNQLPLVYGIAAPAPNNSEENATYYYWS